jgi:hypothetical protein
MVAGTASDVEVVAAVVIVDVCEVLLTVDVSKDTITSALVGTETGQKDQLLRSTDQYRSRPKRRYPTASRFEKHRDAAVLSYMPFPKQAADSDTAGFVTKFSGI